MRAAVITSGQGTYDRKLEDIFAVQDEIARAIVTNLQIQLTGVEAFALTAPPTRDAEALYTLSAWSGVVETTRPGRHRAKCLSCSRLHLPGIRVFSRAYSNLAAAYVLIPQLFE